MSEDREPVSGPDSPARDVTCEEPYGCGAEPGEKCEHPDFDENPEMHHLYRVHLADVMHTGCDVMPWPCKEAATNA